MQMTRLLSQDYIPIWSQFTRALLQLIGKSLELTFKLKFASEKYLLFWDTQITVDNQTKYYLIKWKFDPRDIEGNLGMSNV